MGCTGMWNIKHQLSTSFLTYIFNKSSDLVSLVSLKLQYLSVLRMFNNSAVARKFLNEQNTDFTISLDWVLRNNVWFTQSIV